jgi:hypothetical protein
MRGHHTASASSHRPRVRRGRWLAVTLAIACSSGQPRDPHGAGDTGASPPPAYAASATPAATTAAARDCPAVDVQDLRTSVVPDPLARADTMPERIEPVAGSTPPAVMLLATGPMLGSMDSREVATSVECATDGATVTATLTRSADYAGGVKKNVLWRPTLSMKVLPRAAAMLRVTWRMRLTTGAEQERAQTPPYPELRYPRRVAIRLPAPR